MADGSATNMAANPPHASPAREPSCRPMPEATITARSPRGRGSFDPVQNFSWLVEGEIAGMARPDPSDAERLRDEGISALVSLTRRPPFFDPPVGLAILHIPVLDMTPPTQAQLLQAVEFLRSVVAAGGRAAVHCVAGYGRTGTVLASYLVAGGEDPEEAIHRVREARPGSIETAEQEHAVHLFGETWRRAGRRAAREKGREKERERRP